MEDEVSVKLEPWVKAIVDYAISRHIAECPIAPRIQSLEIRFSSLLGFMAGSGIIGGALGAGIVKVVAGG